MGHVAIGSGHLEKGSGYHRRSLVATKMRCFKLLGERVNARHFNGQVPKYRFVLRCYIGLPVGYADHGGYTLNPSS